MPRTIPISERATVRTNKRGEQSALVGVMLPVAWIDEIDNVAGANYLNRSDILRMAVRAYLTDELGNE